MKSRNDADKVVKEPKKVVKKEQPKVIKLGDAVKIKPEVSNDMLGRRIHNGVKNYRYIVKLVRDEGYLVLACLTYQFILRPEEVEVWKTN